MELKDDDKAYLWSSPHFSILQKLVLLPIYLLYIFAWLYWRSDYTIAFWSRSDTPNWLKEQMKLKKEANRK